VNIRGIRILNPLIGPNTDGIDIDASSNVSISDCTIYTADDAICLKNEVEGYTDRVCRNVTITNCMLTTVCNAFKIGTGTRGSFENIVFGNSVIAAGQPSEPLAQSALETIDPEHYGNALGPLGGIAIETVDGGAVRGVAVSNIVMHGVRAPIFVRRANRASLRDPSAVPGTLRDVSINNVIAYDASTTSSITGLPGYPVQDVSLSNLRIEVEGTGTPELAARWPEELPGAYPESSMWGRLPAHGFFCRHVEGLTMDNVRVTSLHPDARPLIICDDVRGLRVNGLQSDPSVTAEHLLFLDNVRDAVIRGVVPPPGTRTWVRASGRATENVLLLPDDTRNVETPLELGPDVPSDAVRLRAS
jgi:polygalacturonase